MPNSQLLPCTSGLRRIVFTTSFLLFLANSAIAELYINEIFFDPGGAGLDTRDEYIELRGTPGMSLDNYYLIFVENEDNLTHTGSTGEIENIFTLGDNPNTPQVETPYQIGSNGFLTLRQKDNLYAAPALGTTDLVNMGTGLGWGSDDSSSIRVSDQRADGVIENSGSTVMLIHNHGDPFLGQPFLGLDLDVGNNGLDDASNDQFDWNDNWEIIDSIGYFSEFGEAGLGRLYAPVNFGPEIEGEDLSPSAGGVPDGEGGFVFAPSIEEGAVYVGLGYEIEYVGRWGDSTGQTPDDWHASNLTDKTLSGSSGPPDFRQSGGFHDVPATTRVESNQGVAYGTPLTNTLGASNLFYLDGDFDLDGDVDGTDLLIWQRHHGFGEGLGYNTVDTALRTHGDANGDWVVDHLDLERWQAKYGNSLPSSSVTALVPEPRCFLLFLLGTTLVVKQRCQRSARISLCHSSPF